MAGLENVTLDAGFATIVENDGLLALRNVTVSLLDVDGTGAAIHTGPTGTTKVESTLLSWRPNYPYNPPPPGPACTGTTPISLGANVAVDLSCGLSQPDDHPGANPATTWDLIGTPGFVVITPGAGSMLVDAIPAGVHGCGDELIDDQVGTAWPLDADGDPDIGGARHRRRRAPGSLSRPVGPGELSRSSACRLLAWPS